MNKLFSENIMNEQMKNENAFVQEAEIEKVTTEISVEDQHDSENFERSKKIDMYVEFVLIFILGILVGVAIKTEAVKRVTMGFDDYQMNIARQDFDINKLQVDMMLNSADEISDSEDAQNTEAQ